MSKFGKKILQFLRLFFIEGVKAMNASWLEIAKNHFVDHFEKYLT
jgi:hypothetical protein